MGKKNKRHGIEIPNPKVDSDASIKFSFKYYDVSCDDYCLSSWNKEDIALALDRLKDISCKKFTDIHCNNVYGFRPVRWEQTVKSGGFPIKEANDLEPFHFALVGINNQKARVFGSYANGTFYIIWFDYNHEIWPSFKKHT